MCLLHQHEEQLRDYKELGDICDSLLSKELVESDEVTTGTIRKGTIQLLVEDQVVIFKSSFRVNPSAR